MSRVIKHQFAAYRKAALPEFSDTRIQIPPRGPSDSHIPHETAPRDHGPVLQPEPVVEDEITKVTHHLHQNLLQRINRLESVLQMLSAPTRALGHEVESELADLVIALLRQLFRHEMTMDPTHLITVIREAITLLPVPNREANLVLHPCDVTMVRTAFAEIDRTPAWRIVEDSTITPGGCRIVTRASQVDATIENRLHTLITRVFGEAQASDERF